MDRRYLVLLLVASATAPADVAVAQVAPRSVLPIREVVIRPIGTPRYVVTLIVNGVPVETGIDTGSVGLRLLPRATQRARVEAGGQPVRYSYGSGVQLDGRRASAVVQIGAVRGQVPLQAIEQVSCVDGRDCPAARVPAAAYGLMGSGQPGQGFPAIMGIRLNGGDVPNPLTALGVSRWIVHLPQRSGGDGALILNPDEHDVAGFVPLRAGDGAPGTVGGCVMVARPDARRFCGPTLLDTGAPGITVRGAERPSGWRRGEEARLVLVAAADGPAPATGFRAGDETVRGQARFVAGNNGAVALNAGRLPFYAYDVLFDQAGGGIAVRPSASAADAARPFIADPR